MADTVSIAITGDITGLQAAMDGAADNVNRAADAFVGEFQRASEATERLAGIADQTVPALARIGTGSSMAASGASKFGEAVAAVSANIGTSALHAGAQAILEFGRSAFDSAVNIGREAGALGVSTAALQAYQYAARESGISQEDADAALKTFASNIGALQENAGPAVKAVRDLGLTADELRGDPLEAMETVARSWAKLNDVEERASILRDLSGRSGQDMAAMMERLAGGLDAQAEAARNAGQMLDPNLTAAAENAKVKFDEASTKLMVALTPATIGAVEHITALVNVFNELPSTIESANEAIQDTIDLDEQLLARGMAPVGKRSTKLGEGANPRATNVASAPDPGLLAMANAPMPLPAPPTPEPQIGTEAPEQEVAKEQQAARKIRDIHKQTVDSILQGEEQLNASELALGQESLSAFSAQQLALADKKRKIEEDAALGNERKGLTTHAEYLAQIDLIEQQHANRVAQINEQYHAKLREQDQQDLETTVRAQREHLSETTSSLKEQLSSHQISAQEEHDAEIAAINSAQSIVVEAYEKRLASMDKEADAYKKLKAEELAAEAQFHKQIQAADTQLAAEEMAKWKQLGASIQSSFNTAIDGIIFHGKSLQQTMVSIAQGILESFLHMGEQMLEDWIAKEVMKEFFSKSTDTASALGQISDASAIAGANTFASISAIPIVGPELAPGAAASAVSETMAFASLLSCDVGAWELPSDMPAMLHKGEMVVPQNFASGLRANGGMGGGGDGVTFNTHYYPTINMRDPTSLKDMLQGSGAELFDAIQRGYRTGLPMRPSMRSL
jgi:hypothetical protein